MMNDYLEVGVVTVKPENALSLNPSSKDGGCQPKHQGDNWLTSEMMLITATLTYVSPRQNYGGG
jgi:hypothetical protein